MIKKETIKVLVVDDHPIVRRGLTTEINLDRGMLVVGEAVDGQEAVDQYKLLKPDVVLMDLVMPNKDGIQATREIMMEEPEAKILVLTSFIDEERILEAIKAGALGFIYKDKHPEQVLAAIREINNDVPVLAPNITRKLMRETQTKPEETDIQDLTERELEVLKMVASGRPYKEIAYTMHVQDATIRTHVSNILGKLNLSNRSQLVLYAIDHKLVE
ncbi:MAG: DNA-binding response regulator [Chloroflexi bacterium HGW-Chloroflexi-2]|jgi:DNA-binding NarL/FixJ family response regulator|nr:MAG: DNA-binding response regulator [Chloroflexi bacterium HGW-Chloroflexi-2]